MNPAASVFATSPDPNTPTFIRPSLSLMQWRPLRDTAVDIDERMRHDERIWIDSMRNRLHLADLEPRDDAVQNVLFGVAQSAVPVVDRHAPLERSGDFVPYRIAFARHDRHRRIFLEAVNDEIQRSRIRQVRQDRVQGRLDAE